MSPIRSPLVLDCGPDTWVGGPTAAALHGFDGFRLRQPFHVTTARGRNVQRAHHHAHTVLPPIDAATVHGLAVMSAIRPLIDLALRRLTGVDGHSWLERRYLELCATTRLPRAVDPDGCRHEPAFARCASTADSLGHQSWSSSSATAGIATRIRWPATLNAFTLDSL